jgi:membrane protease subunit HflK
MEANVQRKGLANWVLLLVVGGASAIVARYAHSATGLVSAVFMGLGFLIAAVSYFQMRLEQRERLEQMEFDELKKTAASAKLFAEQAADTFPARRAREQFERFFVPGFTMLLLLAEGAAAYGLWNYASQDVAATPRQGAVAMALYGLFALVLFQFGKYSAVLARLEKQRLLRPQASYLLLGAVLSLVTAGVEVAGWAGYPKVDLVAARVLAVVLGLVAVENLLSLVFELYRPRVKGLAEHPLYESRLIGLLSQPGGIITTVAQALDYQFGFKVSETWFYRFLERAVAWLVLVQLGLLLLSTTAVFVEPGEQLLLERFGRPVPGRAVLGPGPHLKFPWPIDQVHRYATGRIQAFAIGIVQDEKERNERTLVWAKAHAKEEFNMLVASRSEESTNNPAGEQAVPVNLLAVNIPVQYQVSDLRAFAYNHANAGELLEKLATAEITRYLVSVEPDDIMAAGRLKAAEDLRQRIQARADASRLGVKILFVGLHGVHPPVKVAPEFEQVIGAIQDKAATNLYARAYAAERLPLARAEAAQKVNAAEAARFSQATAAAASAGRFTNQLAAWRAAPEVYQWRAFLDARTRAIAPLRKYVVVPTNAQEIVILNLEDKIRPDLLETPLPAAPKKGT